MISLKSEITKAVLNYFFISPHQHLYVNELSRKLSLDKRNLVKKLRELEKEGILQSEKRGNLKLYSLNRTYSLYKEYKKIILATIGFEEKLKRTIQEVQGIKEVYIYGSYAKDTMDVHSDIDVLAVGNHNIVALQKRLGRLQKETDREINIINMDEDEFKKRIKSRDFFILGILRKKHIKIIP